MNILVIDDDSTDVRFLEEMLSEADPNISPPVHVDNLDDAFQQLREVQFDIVLLDFFLPGTNGIESILRLREHIPTVPVVFLTGIVDQELGQEMIEAGAQGYIAKGRLEGEMLVRRLREIISQYQGQK